MGARDDFALRAQWAAVAASAACLAMVVARIALADGAATFAFLSWNLFLAWIPLVLAMLLPATLAGARRRALAVPLLALWLLFLPNAPYLVTDLIHLDGRPAGSPAIDLVMFPAFAATGLLIGVLALHLVHVEVARERSPRVAWTATGACIALSGIGMYLGRVLTWNSWDVLTSPVARARELAEHVTTAAGLGDLVAFTLGLGACLALAYAAFELAARRA
ncbi:MAG: DUF1361 domain-containing protein [Thermoleophilia bacterium]